MKKRGVLIGALFSLISMGLAPISPALADIPCYVLDELDSTRIASGESCTDDVEIPYGITSIGNNAFSDAISLTSLTIPNSVTSIGINAFQGTSSLTTVTFKPGSQLTSIGSGAFSAASSLTSITMPASVRTIGSSAFSFASSLTSITIPSGVTSIAEDTFLNASSLTSITIPNTVKSIGNGAFFGASRLASITLPNSLTHIGDNSFGGASSLTSITIPSGVTSIGESAFQGASGLASITIPNTVTEIGNSAFRDTALISVTIPSLITSISDELFRSVASLTSVNLPSGLTSIGAYSFEGTSISSIDIPSSLRTIGTGAFSRNSSLRSIEIPEGVTSIGSLAFLNDTNLASAKLPDSILVLSDSLFSGASALTSFNFPKNLERIGAKVFVNSGITSVVVPSTVTQIDQFAFAYMPQLKTAIIQNGVAKLLYGVFAHDPELTTVVIPNSVTSIGYDFEFDGSDPDADYVFATTFEGDEALKCATYPTLLSSAFLGGWGLIETFGVVPLCQKSAVGISIAIGLRSATIQATENLPATTLRFAATTAAASVTVTPWSNPAPLSATPFTVSSSTKIVDIQVSGSITGSVTLCLGGTSTDHLFHYKGGQWVELASQTYDSVNLQVCGVTTSFSPFAVAPRAVAPPANSSPDAPASVVATSTGKRSATVSFTAPASNGGSVVTSYTAISTPGGITKTLTQAGGGTLNFDGLQPGTSYTFAVTATNAIGTSVAATSNSVKTTEAAVATLTSLTFTDDGSGTAGKLVWDGKNIDSVLYTGPSGSYPTPFSFGAFTSSWNGSIRNLTPETSYTVSIYAISTDGIGESKSLTFKTGAKSDQVKNLAYWNIWLAENTYFKGEAARLIVLLNKFSALETSPLRSYIKVPVSVASTVTATSLTPKSCSVVSTTAKIDAGMVKALTKDTCTISYTVSGPSKAPATLVKNFVFKKVS